MVRFNHLLNECLRFLFIVFAPLCTSLSSAAPASLGQNGVSLTSAHITSAGDWRRAEWRLGPFRVESCWKKHGKTITESDQQTAPGVWQQAGRNGSILGPLHPADKRVEIYVPASAIRRRALSRPHQPLPDPPPLPLNFHPALLGLHVPACCTSRGLLSRPPLSLS